MQNNSISHTTEAGQGVWKACIPQHGTDDGHITEGWYVCRREEWRTGVGSRTGVEKKKRWVGVAALHSTGQRFGQS